MISHVYENSTLFRQERFEPVSIHIEPRTNVAPMGFLDECVARAVEIHQRHPDAFLALSGGVESQVALRSFLEAGIKPQVLIMRWSQDRNNYDVNPAVTTAEKFGLKPEIVELMPQKIVDTVGRELVKKYQLYTLFDLFVAHLVESRKITLILVDKYDIRRDLSPDKSWCLVETESNYWTRRFNRISDTGYILDNFFMTNKQLLSFLNISRVKNIISGVTPGKISLSSSKREIFTEAGFKHMEHYKPTDHTYYLSGLRDKLSDGIYKTNLYDNRKFNIPVDQYMFNGEKTTWRHI